MAMFGIVLKNYAPSQVPTLTLAKLAQKVGNVFAEVTRGVKGIDFIGTEIDPTLGARAVGPIDVVVYLNWFDHMSASIVHKVTGVTVAQDPNHGGVTSNSAGQGVISEVWWNKMNRTPADLDFVMWAVVHEIGHNKTDVGSLQLGTPYKFKGKVVTDMHAQSGGRVLGKPSVPGWNQDDKDFLGPALSRPVPQYTGRL